MDSTIVLVGERRSGKSFMAMALAERIKKGWDCTKNLFFDPLPFLKKFNEAEDDVLVLDEASESVDARSWYDIQNRVFNSLLTREGYRRNIIIMTFPVLTDLDKRAIRLCSHLITTIGHNIEQKVSYAMAYRLRVFQLMGKTAPRKIQLLKFRLPSQRNIEEYLKMKIKWNARVSQSNIATLEMLEDPETFNKPLPRDRYIEAFQKEKMSEERFARAMRRLGIGEEDVLLLIDLYKKVEEKDLIEPEVIKTQDEIDLEEFMNAKQELDIEFIGSKQKLDLELMIVKIEQEKKKNNILDIEKESKWEQLINPSGSS